MSKEIKSDYWQEILPLWWIEIKLVFGWTSLMNALFRTGGFLFSIWFTFIFTGNLEGLISSLLIEIGKILFSALIFLYIFVYTFIKASNKLWEKQKSDIKNLGEKIEYLKRELETNRKAVKLNLETKIDNYGSIIGLDIRNKSNKDIMDCRVKIKEITVYSRKEESVIVLSNDKEPFYLRWKTVNFEDKSDVWGRVFFYEEEPIVDKKIPDHQTENVILLHLRQSDWDNASFIVEFHSGKKNLHTVKSKKLNKNRSVIDVGMLLEVSFDFENETITRQYFQKICLTKKLAPNIFEGKMVYEPPKINYQFTEWIDISDKT